MARSRIAVIVLAAGAGTRYSEAPGAKLLAPLDGRPVLQHVLQAIRTFAPRTTIVVLGHGADTIERTIDWAGEQRVSNPHPEQGLASSMRVGFAGVGAMRVGIAGVGAIDAPVTHVGAIDSPVDGVFIVLGDQPRLRVDVLEALADAAELDGPPILVASYDEPGPRNPVLLLRPAWALADEKAGDHGLAPLIDARPELVRAVRVPGRMPDVDRADDLAALEKDAR